MSVSKVSETNRETRRERTEYEDPEVGHLHTFVAVLVFTHMWIMALQAHEVFGATVSHGKIYAPTVIVCHKNCSLFHYRCERLPR